MLIGDIVTLSIEKLNSEGDGIGKYNDFVFFVKNSCPGDILNCKITKLKKNYGYAEITEIITPANARITPKCKLHKICGACQLQHISYEAQLLLKKETLKDTLRSILNKELEVNDVIGCENGYNYRSKIQYPVGSTKNSKRILAGYYKENSHELINIKYCPIQPDRTNDIIEFIKTEAEKYEVSAYNEKNHNGLLRHIVLRHSNKTNKILVLLVINSEEVPKEIIKLASKIYNEFKDIVGVSANFNTRKNNIILGEHSKNIIGEDYIEESLCDINFKISGDTFFQVNPKCANKMFTYIKEYIRNNYHQPVILDAYAGIAAFGICLNDIAKEITSVELNKNSIQKANENIKTLELKNIHAICADTKEFLKNSTKVFDIVITDPPRKGCDIDVLNEFIKISKTIIYVSCNPATLARDLKILETNGYNIESIQPFDMFPQTSHIETVVVLTNTEFTRR